MFRRQIRRRKDSIHAIVPILPQTVFYRVSSSTVNMFLFFLNNPLDEGLSDVPLPLPQLSSYARFHPDDWEGCKSCRA